MGVTQKRNRSSLDIALGRLQIKSVSPCDNLYIHARGAVGLTCGGYLLLPKLYANLDVFDAFQSRDTLEAGVIRDIGICS